MDGIERCARYAFGPNRLHYCGPDRNQTLRELIDFSPERPGLAELLREFKTLFPYLALIAQANGIRDPFDARVVEAYWLGNELLEAVGRRRFFNFLRDDLQVKEKGLTREFKWLETKVAQGAAPHHSFHVFNLWRETSRRPEARTLASLDECRVGAGRVQIVNGPEVTVLAEPVLLENGKLTLGRPSQRILIRHLAARYDIEQLRPGQFVSFHWGTPCEVVTAAQAARLRRYTLRNLAFANQTI